MSLNLLTLTQHYLDAHPDNAEIVAACKPERIGPAMVQEWRAGAKLPTLKALQRMIETWGNPEREKAAESLETAFAAERAASVAHTPTFSGDGQASTPSAHADPHFVAPGPGTRLAYCIPMSRRVGSRELGAFSRLFDPAKMQLMTEDSYDNFVNRNRLAHRFLASDCEWSFWQDDDMVPQCGDADWFYLATRANHYGPMMASIPTIGRLMFHQKLFIGGAYFARDGSGVPMWSSARENQAVKNAVLAAGPHEELQGPLNWIGFGCVLIHRKVFEDIRDKVPSAQVPDLELKPHLRYTHGYFDKIGDASDDVSFCLRAREAGHEIFCDLSVMPAHMGMHAVTNRIS